MSYQVITALVAEAAAEAAAIALAAAGLASEQRDQTTLDKPPPGTVAIVTFGEPGEGAPKQIAALLSEAGVEANITTLVSDDESWRDSWKAYFKPRRVGRFVIVPSWESFAPAPADVVLALDPGRAFGTGGHASTRLCLELLSSLQGGAQSFLDAGCGSGVLAIAAARICPDARGVAVDIDPEAVEVTVENAVANRVADRIVASTTPVADVAGSFDLVFANLSAEVLEALAPSLSSRVAAEGTLIASGILVEQADAVAAAFVARGLTVAGALEEEGWRALVLARAGSDAGRWKRA